MSTNEFHIARRFTKLDLIQLDLLKCSIGVKAITYILTGNVELSTYIKLILRNALYNNLQQY